MKIKYLAVSTIGLTLSCIVVMATPLKASAKKLINYVTLQTSTPGTPDIGHINVNGTVIASNFTGNGSGLTSLNAGSLALPISISGSSSGNLASIINLDPNGYALYVKAYSQYGAAIYARSESTTFGIGILATSSGTSSSTAVVNSMSSTGATQGIQLNQSSPDGYGLYASTAGIGINVTSSNKNAIMATSNVDDGIVAKTLGTYRSGVYGSSSAANANGGWFQSSATTGTGVGVGGVAGSASGYGVYSIGRMAATGTKSFQIDDPQDPENYTLSHYCTEGAEPLNVYSGNVTTDSRGYATVQLPDYFGEINKDFRYQLTVVDGKNGEDFVLAKVAKEIQKNKFVVRTNAQNIKVSWRVEAVRNDRWVQRNGAPIRQLKSEAYRGRYLEPSLYDQPASRGMFSKNSEAATHPLR